MCLSPSHFALLKGEEQNSRNSLVLDVVPALDMKRAYERILDTRKISSGCSEQV